MEYVSLPRSSENYAGNLLFVILQRQARNIERVLEKMDFVQVFASIRPVEEPG